MASKKDKFSKQVRRELGQDEPNPKTDSPEGPAASEDMAGLVSDVQKTRRTKDTKTGSSSMPRSRNVYNVSSDVRLEDYTEKAPSRDMGPILRIAAAILLLLLLGFGIYRFVEWISMPSYRLAVASEQITESNLEQYAGTTGVLAASRPLHIRFDWPAGSLTTDYLRIQIDRIDGGNLIEEAMLGRKPPRTANYIYFLGPMDAGAYRITVTDAGGSVLSKREIEIR